MLPNTSYSVYDLYPTLHRVAKLPSTSKFQVVALIGRPDDVRVIEPMQALGAHLTKAGIAVIADVAIAAEISATAANEKDLAEQPDLIIAVGGDGTILYAAEIARISNKPLLGVNRGRLGFLADVSPHEMLSSLDEILAGNYSSDSRMLLNASIKARNGSVTSATGLNDVVLQRRETGRMVDLETRIGNRYINTHAGDGLIVATPTGSTAYSLSCGGPIIEPSLDALVMVPICPHTLSDRPIVVSAGQEIEVVLLQRGDSKADIIVDGRSIAELNPEDTLHISCAAERISLIHPPGYDYYEILRSKLHWGHDSRNRHHRDQNPG